MLKNSEIMSSLCLAVSAERSCVVEKCIFGVSDKPNITQPVHVFENQGGRRHVSQHVVIRRQRGKGKVYVSKVLENTFGLRLLFLGTGSVKC
jgi:hypothetical protein